MCVSLLKYDGSATPENGVQTSDFIPRFHRFFIRFL